jgi:nucleotide-binding universal stress UspA family protein
MRRAGGTIVCGVTASDEARSAAQLAGALAARLCLRLVLVHVLEGVRPSSVDSAGTRERRQDGEELLEALRAQAPDGAETRLVLGDRVQALANVAAEEGADVVVVGARKAGPRGRRLASSLARELPSATPVPVVVAPPSRRKRSERRLASPAGAV